MSVAAPVPDTMKAIVQQDNKTVAVQTKPVPKNLKDNEILLKVEVIGLNPTDWKHVQGVAQPGAIIGCDFVGRIAEAGPNVPQEVRASTALRGGFVRGGMSSENGGFAEYVKIDWDLTFEVPENLTAQQAASAPIPLLTVCQAFFYRMGLPMPSGDGSQSSKYADHWLLVWSGSTAVGQYAIQMAKLIGFKVATTASPNKHTLVKSLGAEVVFDYRDEDVSEKLKSATNGKIVYGLDTIALSDSTAKCQNAFSDDGGHLILLLVNEGNKASKVKTERTLVYTGLGKDQPYGPNVLKATPEDRELIVRSCLLVTQLFGSQRIQALEVEDRGGLESVQNSLDLIRDGKHTGKIVHTIA